MELALLPIVPAGEPESRISHRERYAHLLLGSGDKLKASAFARIQATTGINYADAR
jgi:hypothetical protein